MARGARRLTALTLPEQEDFNGFLIPPKGDLVLLYLLVNGVADSFGARFLLLSLGPFLRGFISVGRGTLYERVLGGYVGHGGAWWYPEEKKGAVVFFNHSQSCQMAQAWFSVSGLPQGTRQTAKQPLVIDVLPHDRGGKFWLRSANRPFPTPRASDAVGTRMLVLPTFADDLFIQILDSRPA